MALYVSQFIDEKNKGRALIIEGKFEKKFASGRFMAKLKAATKQIEAHFLSGWMGGRWKTGWQEERGQGVGRKGSEECERLGGLWPMELKGLDGVEGKTKPHHQCWTVIALKIPHYWWLKDLMMIIYPLFISSVSQSEKPNQWPCTVGSCLF